MINIPNLDLINKIRKLFRFHPHTLLIDEEDRLLNTCNGCIKYTVRFYKQSFNKWNKKKKLV